MQTQRQLPTVVFYQASDTLSRLYCLYNKQNANTLQQSNEDCCSVRMRSTHSTATPSRYTNLHDRKQLRDIPVINFQGLPRSDQDSKPEPPHASYTHQVLLDTLSTCGCGCMRDETTPRNGLTVRFCRPRMCSPGKEGGAAP